MVTHLDRVAVFIDWQNVYQSARRAFALTALPSERGVISPYQVARILAAGNDRASDGVLVKVEIHRGLPSSARDPTGFAANRRHSAAWIKENPDVVIPRMRPLRYPDNPNGEPEEKGIDVQLALSAVEHALVGECEVVVIFSHDTDLVPAIETITRITGKSHVETASWSSPTHKARLRPKVAVFHHNLGEDVFRQVETPVNYAYVE